MKKQTILTGIRPTGHLHIGHYFGAGQNWVKLQDKFDTYIEIADVQALTDNFNNPDKVRKSVKDLVIDLLSIGIDPNKATLFIQSTVPEIAELTVFYSNLVTIARLERNPTVKTEIKQKKELFGEKGESITYGFLGYPVSQAADITAFKGALVPVGEDQLPLLEQCREIVRKFNSIYGETLIEPEAYLSDIPRIKGLDGNEKMGKSLGNAIFLADDSETVKKKIMGAITDPNKIKVDEMFIEIEKGKSNVTLDKYDFCIQLVKDKYIDALLKKHHIRSFNTYEATENCDDKFMTYCLLADNDIKMPTTICGMTNTGVENIDKIEIPESYKNYVEEKLGYPLIMKKSNSKGGRDIYKIDNRQMLEEVCNKIKGTPYMFQEFINVNSGKDIRTVVVGKKLVGSIMRINENDFRSNISLGGKSIKYTVTDAYKKIAEKVATILNLDYCSVDFFLTEDNEPIICEVNADPALTAIEKLGEVNVAKAYAEYIFKEIYG